jgi:hypothetical protein
MLQQQPNPNYKILVATDSEKQKRRLMGYLVEAGYRTHCASASELLKSPTGLRVTPPDLVILDLENEQFAEILQQSAKYAKRHGCHILYSLDPRNIKAFKTQSADADLPYIANNCGSHELELGIEVLRLKAAMDRDARERRREQWALQAMSFIAQRSETQENTLDGIVGIVATALDAACSVMTKDARSEAYQNIASAGASPEEIKKITTRPTTKNMAITSAGGAGTKSEYPTPEPWRPVAKLVAQITSAPSNPSFLFVWSDAPRTFSDVERTLVSVAAVYSGLAIISSSRGNRA